MTARPGGTIRRSDGTILSLSSASSVVVGDTRREPSAKACQLISADDSAPLQYAVVAILERDGHRMEFFRVGIDVTFP